MASCLAHFVFCGASGVPHGLWAARHSAYAALLSPGQDMSSVRKQHASSRIRAGIELQLSQPLSGFIPVPCANRSATTERQSRFCFDARDKLCMMCNEPMEVYRDIYADGSYIVRRDCGRRWDESKFATVNLDTPLYTTYSRPQTSNFLPPKWASPSEWTSGFCELNAEKGAADAEANHDYFYYAAGFFTDPGNLFDFYYCKYNGYLRPSMTQLIHNYSALYDAAAKICVERDAEYDVRSITFRQYWANSPIDAVPTPANARFLAAWTCAMGGPGNEIAYCGAAFRDLSDEDPATWPATKLGLRTPAEVSEPPAFCMYPEGPPAWSGVSPAVYNVTAADIWRCPRW